MASETKRDEGIADDQFEVKVTFTVGLPHRGEHPGTRKAMERVYNALAQREALPDGTRMYGYEVRVLDPKDLRKRARKIRREEEQQLAAASPTGEKKDG